MSYRIQLQNFEGPLDLLLFLIKKNEVDIYDIPIAAITQQYMEYLQAIELLDLDHASEFILMAATLIRIKAHLLLPKPEMEEDEDLEDPRQELVQRLLEYQRFKEVAENLGEFEKEGRELFMARNYAFEDEPDQEEGVAQSEVALYDLMAVFVDVLKRVPPVTEHTVERIPVTIEDQAAVVLDFLDSKERVLFRDLLMTQVKEKIILIVTFIAILELVRSQKVALNQSEPFAEIWIRKN
ncbi:MAG: segregation and condensation protein A [bacterium]